MGAVNNLHYQLTRMPFSQGFNMLNLYMDVKYLLTGLISFQRLTIDNNHPNIFHLNVNLAAEKAAYFSD